ncbi:thioredoxin domain-containing protein 16-like [Haliotis rufescens]|uniref:thioredoxin domain-containing protein 16-like n=1 Tax=Haliotis rufescens TaxID=6454 RepID=UPI00201F51D4|nr:thioredoxin domain-containing protein 16-like [Haliotis rufescens]
MALIFSIGSIWNIVLGLLVAFVCAEPSIPFDFKHVEILTPESHTSLQHKPFVSVIYYYKRELPRLRAFFKELDKSAEYLDIYGTKTGILDCSGDAASTVEECKTARVEYNVYSYRDGNSLLTLELETMFDVNSIMSNILQLILLHEVPIVQSRSDRQQIELKQRGKSDVIFSFHKAIGTYEHRVFMEVAYAYQDRYKFGLTTETKTAEGLKEAETVTISDDAAVWVLYCRDADEDSEGCPSVRYRGKMDLPSLAVFLKALSLPRIFELPEHGTIPSCRNEKFHCVFLYYDRDTKEQVFEAAETLKFEIYGVAGIVVVDTEKIVFEDAHGFNGKTPAISVFLKEEEAPRFMTTEWSLDNIASFIQSNLFDQEPMDVEGGSQEGTPGSSDMNEKDMEKTGYNFPSVEEVETQDDQVAEAVFQLSRDPMKLSLIPALTDKTFPATVQERDLLAVLFYLPFDSRSMAFLRAYGEASFSLEDKHASRSPLGRVNCYDWMDVCGQQNVSSYPTVRFFKKGQDPTDYKGALDTDAVVSVVKLMQQESPMMLTTQTEVQKFVAGTLPENIIAYTNMSVLGLFVQTGPEVSAFKEVAGSLQNTTVFAHVQGQLAKDIAEKLGQPVPCVLVFRHDDPYSDTKSLTTDLTADRIKTLVSNSRLPTLPELTADVFPLMYSQDKPLLILFCDKYEEAETTLIKKTVADLALSGLFPGVVFAWMHARGSSIGATIFSEYAWSSVLPALSLVYHRTGKVYNKVEGEYSPESVQEWLSRAVSGQEEPAKVLPQGDWKPAARSYDFLGLSEFESKYGESPEHKPTLQAAEEFGAGFNSDGTEIEYETSDSSEDEGQSSSGNADDEIRNELLELRSSRLYHQVPDRKESPVTSQDVPASSAEESADDLHKEHPKHTEL